MSEPDDPSVSVEEDGSRSGSATPHSTSTYEYSHEPYEAFQDKVLVLARELGDCATVTLQRHRGGSYNRVVIADFAREGKSVRGIFRIPRFPATGPSSEVEDSAQSSQARPIDGEVQDQAAVLQLLELKHVSAPRLLAFDASAMNAISAPYVLQGCSEGVALNTVYDNMSLPAKLSIAEGLVETLLCAERTVFPQSGGLVVSDRASTAASGTYFFDHKGPELGVDVKPIAKSSGDLTALPLPDLLLTKLEESREKAGPDEEDNIIGQMWRRLSGIVVQMRSRGFFEVEDRTTTSTSHSVLYHWDLEPRNILVKPVDSPDGSWKFDMVIDWDRTLAVPAVLTRKPPVWLWDFSEDDSERASIGSDYDGDVDLLAVDRYDAGAGRLSEDNLRIRQRFEDAMVRGLAEIYPGYGKEAYRQEAYGNGRWIRRIARFAIHGASDNQDFTRFEHLDREWTAFVGENDT